VVKISARPGISPRRCPSAGPRWSARPAPPRWNAGREW